MTMSLWTPVRVCVCVCGGGGGWRGVAKKVVCSDEILCMGFDVADSLYKMLC